MNDAPPSLDDLISRHFDEALPLAEHQRLTAALNEDFEIRRNFVEAARLHTGLEALAPVLRPCRKRYASRWLIAGAAAALMMGGGALFLHQPLPDQMRIAFHDMDAAPGAKPEKPKPPGIVKRVLKRPAALLAAVAEPTEMQKLLERYYVNVTPNGLTVPEALGQLEDAIKEVNFFRRSELSQLTFRAGTGIFPHQVDAAVFTKQSVPMTAGQYLNLCVKLCQVGQIIHGQGKVGEEVPVEYRQLAVTKRSVSFSFITLGELLLPTGFNENTGKIVSKEEFHRFEAALPMKGPQRTTGWLDQQMDQALKCYLGNTDDVASIYSNHPDPEWLSVEFDFAAQPMGELISVRGKVSSHGWKVLSPSEKTLGRKGVSDARFNTGRVGVCLPTEFEVWLQPNQIALFILDSPPGSLKTMIGVSVGCDRHLMFHNAELGRPA